MRVQLLHLNGPSRGRTITYAKDVLVIGTELDADVRYPVGLGVAPKHATIEFVEEGCAYYLRADEGQVFVNRREVREVILESEDLLEVGVGGPKLRFRIDITDGKTCKPFRVMLRDAREVRAEGGLVASSHSLRRDLLVKSSRRMKLGLVLVLALAVLGAANLVGWIGTSRTAREETRWRELQEERYQREIATLQEQIAEFREQQTGHASRAELTELRKDLSARAGIMDQIAQRNDALRKVLDVYSQGVCLLHGSYTYQVKKNDVLEPVVGPDGKALEMEYVGSGFLVTEDGIVVTNRHIAEPWWSDPTAEALMQRGLVPTFVHLAAVFPGKPPIEIDIATILLSREDVDIAVLRVDVEGAPALPLFDGDVRALRGGRVILLGYPTGLNAILARSEPALVEEVIAGVSDTMSLITELAARGAIVPVITQGALNEVRERRLVYDAETTSGGSGGPVFGPGGTVIGVNFAVTHDFDGTNFGIPIEFAQRLLNEVGPPKGD